MARLSVNVDHVATLRQARGGAEPDPVLAAMQSEQAGAIGVTIHLREDRRHIQDRDLRLIREVTRGRLNLEMAATAEMVGIALEVRPDMVTLVPERREELTTEGGLDVAGGGAELKKAIGRLREGGLIVSLFIDAEERQIEASRDAGAHEAELHTGPYALARGREAVRAELDRLRRGGEWTRAAGLRLNAGHGLDYHNTAPVAALPGMSDLNIGHAIVSRAIFAGFPGAVAAMVRLVEGDSCCA